MSRRAARCTEAELKRAVKTALALTGRAVVEISTEGPIRVIAEPIPAQNGNAPKRRIAL